MINKNKQINDRIVTEGDWFSKESLNRISIEKIDGPVIKQKKSLIHDDHSSDEVKLFGSQTNLETQHKVGSKLKQLQLDIGLENYGVNASGGGEPQIEDYKVNKYMIKRKLNLRNYNVNHAGLKASEKEIMGGGGGATTLLDK